VTDPKSPEDRFNMDPAFFAAVAGARARETALDELGKIGVLGAEAEVRRQRAEAQEAHHRAAAEPERQSMALRERETRRRIQVGMALFLPAFLVTVLLVAPWVIPPTGIAAAFAYLWRGSG
jgi:hypothetical protein